MQVQCEQLAEGLAVVLVTGRLDQRLAPNLAACLQQAMDDGHTKLIADLSEATYINSSGLRTLVTAWRRARKQGGDLVICGLNERLQELFVMVGFDKVFTLHATRAAAQAALLPTQDV